MRSLILLLAMLLTPGVASAIDRYVDNTLAATCIGSTYRLVTRTCTGTDGPGYKTLQEACNVVNPGDVVHVRAGTFNFPVRTNACTLTSSGTAGNRITLQPYGTEFVDFIGPYNVDTDANGVRDWDEESIAFPGNASGPTDTGDRGRCFSIGIDATQVVVDYITVKGLKCSWFYRGIDVTGNNNIITENVVEHVWQLGIILRGNNNTVMYNHVRGVRHHVGIFFSFLTLTSRADNNLAYRNLSFGNGRHCTNTACTTDAQVLPIFGDPAGGGNSDGFVFEKGCQDLATPPANHCVNNVVQENAGWRNVDDGFDFSANDHFVIANITVQNGPSGRRGVKGLRNVQTSTWVGNVAIGTFASGATYVQHIGLEPRTIPGGTLQVMHNAGTRHDNSGVAGGGAAGVVGHCANNVAWENLSNDVNCVLPTPSETNYNGNVSGTPPMVGPLFDFTSAFAAAEVSTGFPATTIASRWLTLYSAVIAKVTPTGASLIDAGTFVADYHCPLADDAGQNPTAACRHWMGSAPDIGPVEAGWIAPPGCIQPDLMKIARLPVGECGTVASGLIDAGQGVYALTGNSTTLLHTPGPTQIGFIHRAALVVVVIALLAILIIVRRRHHVD